MQRGGTGMRYNDKRKRRMRIRPRFYIFLAVFLGLIAAIVFGIAGIVSLLAGSREEAVTLGVLEETSEFRAIILRDESPVSVVPYEAVNYKVSENQTVAAGDEVVEIFIKGYSNDLLVQLEAERLKLEQRQAESTLGNIVNEDLQEYDNHLSAKSIEIQNFVQSGVNGAKIVDLERELSYIMTSKQEYMKRSQSTMQDTAIQEIYERIDSIEKRIASYRETYMATRDGRVSFFLDGMEYFLNMSTLPSITATDAENMIKGSTPTALPPEEKAKAYVYRIVDPTKWYTLLVSRAKEWNFSVGQEIEMFFEGYEDTPFVAKVDDLREDGDNVLIVLAMSEDIGPLINARSVVAKIGGRIEGMVVPLSALMETGGVRGVTLADGSFVAVEVRGQDGVDALVMPVEEGKLAPGMRVLRK